jgi:hypothetical protein
MRLFVYADLSHIPVSARLRWSFELVLIPGNCFFTTLSIPKSKRITDVVTDFRFEEVES